MGSISIELVFFVLGAILAAVLGNLVVSEMQNRAVIELKASIDRLIIYLEKRADKL